MRVRVLHAFVIGPGVVARKGDVLDIENETVRKAGIVFHKGPIIPTSYYERIDDEPVAAREPQVQAREVTTRTRKRARTARRTKEEQG